MLNEKPEKKALLSFAKVFHEHKYEKFIVHFSKELEMVANGQSSVVTKRNEIYKKAFKIFRVRRKRFKKTLKQNFNEDYKKNLKVKKDLKKNFNEYSKENLNQIIKKALKRNIGKKSKQILKKYLNKQRSFGGRFYK